MPDKRKIAVLVDGYIHSAGSIDFLKTILTAILRNNNNKVYLFIPTDSLYGKFTRLVEEKTKAITKFLNKIFPSYNLPKKFIDFIEKKIKAIMQPILSRISLTGSKRDKKKHFSIFSSQIFFFLQETRAVAHYAEKFKNRCNYTFHQSFQK